MMSEEIKAEIKLDRKRSYGTVYNDPSIAFVQDERYFKPDGTLHVPVEQKADLSKVPTANDFPVVTELVSAVNKLNEKLGAETLPKRDTLTRNGVQPSK